MATPLTLSRRITSPTRHHRVMTDRGPSFLSPLVSYAARPAGRFGSDSEESGGHLPKAGRICATRPGLTHTACARSYTLPVLVARSALWTLHVHSHPYTKLHLVTVLTPQILQLDFHFVKLPGNICVRWAALADHFIVPSRVFPAFQLQPTKTQLSLALTKTSLLKNSLRKKHVCSF